MAADAGALLQLGQTDQPLSGATALVKTLETQMASSAAITKKQLETLARFRYELRRYLRYSEQVSRKHGVTPLQYQLLLQIKGYPGRDWASVSELAERLQAKHHGVVALITRCESLGLVTRRNDDHDRRRVIVELTAKGERRLQKLAELHRAELLQLQEQFFVPTQEDL